MCRTPLESALPTAPTGAHRDRSHRRGSHRGPCAHGRCTQGGRSHRRTSHRGRGARGGRSHRDCGSPRRRAWRWTDPHRGGPWRRCSHRRRGSPSAVDSVIDAWNGRPHGPTRGSNASRGSEGWAPHHTALCPHPWCIGAHDRPSDIADGAWSANAHRFAPSARAASPCRGRCSRRTDAPRLRGSTRARVSTFNERRTHAIGPARLPDTCDRSLRSGQTQRSVGRSLTRTRHSIGGHTGNARRRPVDVATVRPGRMRPRVPVGVVGMTVIVNDVRRHRPRKGKRARAVHPRRDRHITVRIGEAAVPNEARWRRRPTHVVDVAGCLRHAPLDPSRSVATPRDPGPAQAIDPHPTTVVKDHPAKREIALPQPVARRVERPVAVRNVRRKVAADDFAIGDPNGAVRGFVHEVAIRLELALKCGERARITVGVLTFGSDLVVARRVVRSRRTVGSERGSARALLGTRGGARLQGGVRRGSM